MNELNAGALLSLDRSRWVSFGSEFDERLRHSHRNIDVWRVACVRRTRPGERSAQRQEGCPGGPSGSSGPSRASSDGSTCPDGPPGACADGKAGTDGTTGACSHGTPRSDGTARSDRPANGATGTCCAPRRSTPAPCPGAPCATCSGRHIAAAGTARRSPRSKCHARYRNRRQARSSRTAGSRRHSPGCAGTPSATAAAVAPGQPQPGGSARAPHAKSPGARNGEDAKHSTADRADPTAGQRRPPSRTGAPSAASAAATSGQSQPTRPPRVARAHPAGAQPAERGAPPGPPASLAERRDASRPRAAARIAAAAELIAAS